MIRTAFDPPDSGLAPQNLERGAALRPGRQGLRLTGPGPPGDAGNAVTRETSNDWTCLHPVAYSTAVYSEDSILVPRMMATITP